MYFVILAFLAIASGLVWYLLAHDHGRKLPVGSLWVAAGFGVLAMVLAVVVEQLVFPSQFAANPTSLPIIGQFIGFMGIGFIEEAAKFVPLALFIYRKPYFREHTDGCVYFAICGLAFGLGENIMYTISYGTSTGLLRLILTPFLHAAATSILGYYLVNRKINPSTNGLFILACIIVPVMHGLYDFGLGAGIAQLQVISLMMTLLFTLGLFLYFMHANLLDRLATVSAVVDPKHFCTGCGRPNQYHGNYCEYCGRKL